MKTQNPISAGGAGGQNVAGYVGEIVYFADTILRKNHVWADGAPVDPEQWPQLAEYAAAAGWTQNEAGQYLTPDLRGRFLLGASASHAAGSTGGEEKHLLSVAEMPKHRHELTLTPGDKSDEKTGLVAFTKNQTYQLFNGSIGIAGGSSPHNNMPPYYTAVPQIRAKVDVIQAQLPTCPYEVGDILQTKSAALPSARWPGTEWAAIETFLLGASANHAAGSTGGEEKHLLSVAEMPAHQHVVYMGSEGTSVYYGPAHIAQQSQMNYNTTGLAGNSQSHNNMPPYTTVYIWERTA